MKKKENKGMEISQDTIISYNVAEIGKKFRSQAKLMVIAYSFALYYILDLHCLHFIAQSWYGMILALPMNLLPLILIVWDVLILYKSYIAQKGDFLFRKFTIYFGLCMMFYLIANLAGAWHSYISAPLYLVDYVGYIDFINIKYIISVWVSITQSSFSISSDYYLGIFFLNLSFIFRCVAWILLYSDVKKSDKSSYILLRGLKLVLFGLLLRIIIDLFPVFYQTNSNGLLNWYGWFIFITSTLIVIISIKGYFKVANGIEVLNPFLNYAEKEIIEEKKSKTFMIIKIIKIISICVVIFWIFTSIQWILNLIGH